MFSISWFGPNATKRDSHRSLLAKRCGLKAPGGVSHRRIRFEPLEQRTLLSAGDVDPTFGDGGIVKTNLGDFANSGATDIVATQNDGKTVVAGYRYLDQANDDFVVARYNADGSLDTAFGSNGVAVTDFNGASDYPEALAIQSDGKIVLAGYSFQGENGADFALARYNPDGSLDTGFGSSGKVTTPVASSTSDDRIRDVAVREDGRIVAVGSTYVDTFPVFAMACYNSAGSLDATFGDGGKVTTHFAGSIADQARGVTLQGDKIVVTGRSNASASDNAFAVARYHADGRLDASFGSGGLVTTSVGMLDGAWDVVVQEVGGGDKILVVGPADDATMLRYNDDGTLDTSFGGDGIVTSDYQNSHELPRGVAVEGNRIFVASQVSFGNQSDFAVSCYEAVTGGLDTSFGNNGWATADFGSGDAQDCAEGLAVDPDGKVVLAGRSSPDGDGDWALALARFDAAGNLDSTFGSNGKVLSDIRLGTDDYAYDAAGSREGDGKIVVIGPSDGVGYLLRYNRDGTLDATFGQEGKLPLKFGVASFNAQGVDVQADGKIVAVGYALQESTQYDFAVMRFNNDGTLDTSFGAGGLVAVDFGNKSDYAFDVTFQDVGDEERIVVGGRSFQGITVSDFAIARLNPNGSLDTTFSSDGKATLSFDAGSYEDRVWGVAAEPDGRIILAGQTVVSDGDTQFAVACYNLDGTPNLAFGGDGNVQTGVGTILDVAYAVAFQGDKIVAAGYSRQPSTNQDFAVVRYNPDGTLDASFGGDGIVTAHLGPPNQWDLASSLAISGDKLIVAGRSFQGTATDYDVAVVRYNYDGSLDSDFGTGGVVITSIASGKAHDRADAIVLQDNRIIAIGYSYTDATRKYDFALVAYEGDMVPGSLRGQKWEDLNGDGVHDENEQGMEGVTIYLDLDFDGELNAATEPFTLTDANGFYQFTDVMPGRYAVREVPILAYEQTFPQGEGDFFYAIDRYQDELLKIDAETGFVTIVGPHGAGRDLHGMVRTNSGELYAVSGEDPDGFYSLDPATGVATLIGPTGCGVGYGLAYDSATDTIYGHGNGGLVTYDRTTGTATRVGEALAITGTGGIAFDDASQRIIIYDTKTNQFYACEPDGTPISLAGTSTFWSNALAHTGETLVMSRSFYGDDGDNYNKVLLAANPDTGVVSPWLTMSEARALESLEFVNAPADYHQVTLASGALIDGLDFGNAPGNLPPVAVPDAATTDEDTLVSVDVLANDIDFQNDPLRVESVSETSILGASLSIGVDGTVFYDPRGAIDSLRAGELVTDTFAYTVIDSKGGLAVGTVTVTVTGLNDVPLIGNDLATTDENTSTSISVLSNDIDPENDTVSVDSVPETSTLGAALSIEADGTILYEPVGRFDFLQFDESLEDTFTYTVSDANGGMATATVTVTVIGVNDAPAVDLNGPDADGGDFAAIFTEDGGPIAVADGEASITDLDGGATSATVAVDGSIYVLTSAGRVVAVDPETFQQTYVYSGSVIGSGATGLAIDDNTGLLYAVNYGAVYEVNPETGSCQSLSYGTYLYSLEGIDIGPNSEIYVVSKYGNRIVKVNRDSGAQTIVSSGTMLYYPIGISVDLNGDLIVTNDGGTNRVIRVNPATGSQGLITQSNYLNRPEDVAIAADGDYLVADYSADRIIRIDAQTGVQTPLSYGNYLNNAYDLDVNADGSILVVDYYNGLIQVDSTSGSQIRLASGGLIGYPRAIDVGTEEVPADLVSATVTLTNPLDGGDETLTADTTGTGITASYNVATGVLSLAGDGTLGQYEEVLRSVTYENASNAPDTTARVITIAVNDGSQDSTITTTTLEVVAVNDAPVLDLNGPNAGGTGFASTFTEDAGPVTIVDSDVSITDVDGGVMDTVVGKEGVIYVINSEGKVLSIDPETGDASSVYSGDLIGNQHPHAMAFDETTGLLYVATYRKVLEVDPIAETCRILATSEYFGFMEAIEVGPNGEVYFLDVNEGISRIDPVTGVHTKVVTRDAVMTIPLGMAIDSAGNLIVCDHDPNGKKIIRINPDTGEKVIVTQGGFLAYPEDIEVDANGDYLVVQRYLSRTIVRVDAGTGEQTIVSEGGYLVKSYALDLDSEGKLLVADNNTGVIQVDPTDGSQVRLAYSPYLKGIGAGEIDELADIASATVTLTNPLNGADESLSANTTGSGIAATYDSATGILALIGDGTYAQYASVLRSVTYENLSDAPDTTPRVIAVVVNDGGLDSPIATMTLSLVEVNDPPVVDLNGPDIDGGDFAAAFTEDGGPIAVVGADVSITDADGGVAGAAVAGNGTIYVLTYNGRVVAVDPETLQQTYVYSGTLISYYPDGLAIDDNTGLLYVVNASLVYEVNPETGSCRIVSSGGSLNSAEGIDVGPNSEIYIANRSGHYIVKVDRDSGAQTIVTSAGMLSYPIGITVNLNGDLIVTNDGGTNRIVRVDPANGSQVLITDSGFLNQPQDVTIDANGDYLVADYNSDRIIRVDAETGVQTSVSYGNYLNSAYDLDVRADGSILVVDYYNGLIQVDPTNGSQVQLTSGGLISYPRAIVVEGEAEPADIASATITLTNPLDGTEEILGADATGTNITASYNSATGVLSLTGADTIENYELVLRSITYNNASQAPNITPRVIQVVVNDGADDSLIATTIMEVVAVNDAPSLTGIPDVAFDEDNSDSSVDLDAYYTDIETPAEAATFEVVSAFSGITAEIDPLTHVLTIIGDPNFNGEGTVVVRVTDTGDGTSPVLAAEDTLVVTVRPVNDAPILAGILDVAFDEDSSDNSIDLDAYYSDIETPAEAATFEVVSAFSGITAEIDPVTHILTITGDPNFNGEGTVVVRVTDTGDGTSPVLAAEDTLVVTVRPVNDAPILAGILDVAFDEDSSDNSIDLDAYYSDIETPAEAATFEVVSAFSGITAEIDPVTHILTITGDPNFNGEGTVVVRVTDTGDGTSSALSVEDTLVVTVRPVNDAPTLTGVPDIAFDEDSSDSSIDLDAYFSDIETLAQDATFEVVSAFSGITAEIDPVTHVLTITGDSNFNGEGMVAVRVTDTGDGTSAALSVEDTLLVTVRPINDLPIADSQVVSVKEDGVVTITLSASDVETTEANLTFTLTSIPEGGTLRDAAGNEITIDDSGNIVNGTFVGAPTLKFEPGIACDGARTTSFSFTVTDRGDPDNNPLRAAALTSAPATVTIGIVQAIDDGQVTVGSDNVVRIGGTTDNDIILVWSDCGDEYLHVCINGSSEATILMAGVTEIRAWGREGNDVIILADVDIMSLLHGGAGNDLITGGAGSDLVFGGAGIDLLVGAAGNDLLVGGDGVDRIVGSSGHDILVAREVDCSYTDEALREILADWGDGLAIDGTEADGLLDESILDDDFDMLTGSSGSDWFIIGECDWITDIRKAERDGDLVTEV